ncbi:MAG: pyridoxal-phosphate dependent enzyme [Planctomycetota bacterium]|nr:MAG: pyridoxal-phosphate dependent enzyme [Planctomycetota bacterium]
MRFELNPLLRRFVCSLSGAEVPFSGDRPLGLCPCCPPPGAPLLAHYDLDRVRAEWPAEALGTTGGPGLSRFAPLLPVSLGGVRYAGDVGDTPVVPLALPGEEGVLVKHEGTNPSGSFKDRGLSVGVALGVALGARRFCLPTQGNAGVAAALFSARAGLSPVRVAMPAGYEDGPYARAAAFFGAELSFAGENIAAAGAALREELAGALAAGEVVDLSTFFEPGRLEGKKTLGLELWRELGPAGLPEWIVYPTGGGTGLVGLWKAFRELEALGYLPPERLPRLAAVQSAGCAPVVASFERGDERVLPVRSRGTVADGLDVPGAIMGHGILRALRESRGAAVAVPDEAILGAWRELGRAGLGASLEGAATLAGLRALRARGAVEEGARVLLLSTGGHTVPLALGR